MNKLTTLAIIGVLSLGTACMAMASGSDDSAGPANNDPNAAGIIVIETVAYTDTGSKIPMRKRRNLRLQGQDEMSGLQSPFEKM